MKKTAVKKHKESSLKPSSVDEAVNQLRESIERNCTNEQIKAIENKLNILSDRVYHESEINEQKTLEAESKINMLLDRIGDLTKGFHALSLKFDQSNIDRNGEQQRIGEYINKALSELARDSFQRSTNSLEARIDGKIEYALKGHERFLSDIKSNYEITENRIRVISEQNTDVKQIKLEQNALKMDYISRIDSLLNIINNFIEQNKAKVT